MHKFGLAKRTDALSAILLCLINFENWAKRVLSLSPIPSLFGIALSEMDTLSMSHYCIQGAFYSLSAALAR